MTSADDTTAKLRGLIDAANNLYKGHQSVDTLASYVHGVVLPVLVDLFNDTILSRHRPDPYPSTIVHYTSLSNIVSMLEDDDGLMRLYDANQSNDPEEGEYLLAKLRFPDEYSWVHEFQPSRRPRASYAYVASFVAAEPSDTPDDNLIYWRTYGKEGAGCSLTLANPQGGLQRVLYGEDAVARTLEALLPVVEILDPLVKVDETLESVFSAALWEALEAIRYLYKAEEYSFEKEARYIMRSEEVDAKLISFDTQGSSIFPSRVRHYRKYDALNLKALLKPSSAAITLGPSISNVAPDIDELKRSLRLLLTKHDLNAFVRESSIIYRQM